MKPKAQTGKRKHASNLTDSDEEALSKSSESNPKRVRWDDDVDVVEEEVDDSSEDEEQNLREKVCLAITCQFGRIGGAYYDPITFKIFVLEDSHESPQYDLTKMLVEQADPDVLLVSSKAEDGCVDILQSYMDTRAGIFQVRPFKDFLPRKGRDRVLSLRLLSVLNAENLDNASSSEVSSEHEPRNAYDFMRKRREVGGDPTMQRWHASIRLANHASIENTPLCVGSMGALLDHLVRARAVGELEDEGIGGLDIRDIESLALKEAMQINADALYSLQVFDSENHASIHSDKTKEGLSLYGILNNTKTALGRNLLRQWLLRPSMSISVITERHDAVACFIRPENINTAGAMHSHLKGIKNVPRILSAMNSGRAKASDWQGLVKFAFHSVMLRDALSELNGAGHVEVLKKLCDTLDVGSFKEIGTAVNGIIDWEESASADRVCVKPHVDEDLDKRKHLYNGIDSVLSKVAQDLSTTVPADYAASLNVVYFPQLGFLICVPMLEEWKEGGIVVLEGWSFQFSSEASVYFKSQEMHDLDKHVGDIHSAIVDREIEIIQGLLEDIMIYEKVMTRACDICAELDCLLSFAEASRVYDYRRPELTDENILKINGGRHPLQELVVDTFVPNDVCLVGSDFSGNVADFDDTESRSSDQLFENEHNSIIVCTGANACGKSVYLKQVATIQYMAQIGCFVPAQSATLGIVDKIFTRIQTRESVSKVQSAFMIDLNQVSLALRNATPRSLLLLDEFGKGTVSADGAGLFYGILKHLTGRGRACPKVLAATHFHEVFREDIVNAGELPVTFVHMRVLLSSSDGDILSTESRDEDDETGEQRELALKARPGDRITYLYKIGKGLSLTSFAAMCAELFGIPRHVVRRAQYVSEILANHELGRLLDEEMTEEERIELEDSEEVCRRFLAWDLEAAKAVIDIDVKEVLRKVIGRESGNES